MRLPDDSSLEPVQLATVRLHAERLLDAAGARGRFPTPIDDLVAAANLKILGSEVLSPANLRKFAKAAKIDPANIKAALGKVLGVIDTGARHIIIDSRAPKPRVPFVKLHEVGHGTLPHQAPLYSLIHDCEGTLDLEIADLFEREANVFASEVLFQGEVFAQQARDLPIGIASQLELAKKFGASNYATMRRFAASTDRTCCLVVLDPPTRDRDGSRIAHVRRVVASPTFAERFDLAALGSRGEPGHPLSPAQPASGSRLTGRREVALRDRQGDVHACASEAFDSTHQVLILVWEVVQRVGVRPIGAAARGPASS